VTGVGFALRAFLFLRVFASAGPGRRSEATRSAAATSETGVDRRIGRARIAEVAPRGSASTLLLRREMAR
jgi:hypothetical protein